MDHLNSYAQEMIKMFNLKPGMLVSDIGSNDGTYLSFFKKKGMKVIGIDPAIEIANNAIINGIETVVDFFNFDLSKKLKKNLWFSKLHYFS